MKIEELVDGTLQFDLEVLGSGLLGDLRGVFFDLAGVDASNAGLSITGINGSQNIIGGTVFSEEGVDRVYQDVNVEGAVIKEQGKFDVGIEFGTEGIGEDDIRSASFILSASTLPAGEMLSLDSLDLADFGLRYTSVGNELERSASAKIAGDASGVAYNDAWEVDENSTGKVDLLQNDSNGVLTDGTRKTVISVVDLDVAVPEHFDTALDGSFERTVVIDQLELGTILVSLDGYATFTADGPDVDKLAHDDIRTWSFTYETQSTAGNLATADVVLTIDGQNDQPVAVDIAQSVSEDDSSAAVDTDTPETNNSPFSPGFTSLTGTAQTFLFDGSDIDIGDLLTYEILGVPTDADGNEYGVVINNNDGSFTFDPEDDFQFLKQGETREVTFQYKARDNSGVGENPTSPEETELSDPATVTITVEGADDADNSFSENLLFLSDDQSQFGTGNALSIASTDNFVGVQWAESFSAQIVKKETFDLVIADVTTPGVSVVGATNGKIGLAPFFTLNSGEVDSEIPVEVVFTTPRQVEAGDIFTIGSAYTVDQGATFLTQSPSLRFGVDLVLEAALQAAVKVTSSTFGGKQSFNIANIDLDATTNILTFDTTQADALSSELFEIPQTFGKDIDLGGFGTLLLETPDLEVTGTLDAAPTLPDLATISGTGEDNLVTLTADLDALATEFIPLVPPFSFEYDKKFEIDYGLDTVNLLSFDVGLELLDLDLINTLSVVQDFSLGIEELPLVITFEDGSTLDGFVGDDITVNALSGFDADTEGDGDGLIDFAVDVDMEAVFSNLTTLGFKTDIFFGLLSAKAEISSFFFDDDIKLSLFSNNKFGSTTSDDFFISFQETLFETDDFATLFNDEFDLEGFETNLNTVDEVFGFYDVA